jgi:hypothetical protein
MNSTTTPTPTFVDLTNDIYAVMLDHRTDPRFDYFVDAYAAVMHARRVTRIDLWELLNAVTDFGRVDNPQMSTLNANIALNNLNRVFVNMDAASAFATTDYPLVIDANDEPDYYNFSVLAHDTAPMRDAKRARQTPSVPSYREYIAR